MEETKWKKKLQRREQSSRMERFEHRKSDILRLESDAVNRFSFIIHRPSVGQDRVYESRKRPGGVDLLTSRPPHLTRHLGLKRERVQGASEGAAEQVTVFRFSSHQLLKHHQKGKQGEKRNTCDRCFHRWTYPLTVQSDVGETEACEQRCRLASAVAATFD
ncbi:uncharacterized protein V6R79_010084 [Siganus canaliculatus]